MNFFLIECELYFLYKVNSFSTLVHPAEKFISNLGAARWWSKVHGAHGEQPHRPNFRQGKEMVQTAESKAGAPPGGRRQAGTRQGALGAARGTSHQREGK